MDRIFFYFFLKLSCQKTLVKFDNDKSFYAIKIGLMSESSIWPPYGAHGAKRSYAITSIRENFYHHSQPDRNLKKMIKHCRSAARLSSVPKLASRIATASTI